MPTPVVLRRPQRKAAITNRRRMSALLAMVDPTLGVPADNESDSNFEAGSGSDKNSD